MSGGYYGRQTLGRKFYSDAVIDEVLTRVTNAVAAGTRVDAVFTDPNLPCRASFYTWLKQDAGLRDRYKAARAARRSTNNGV
jgi:hypothetical protein